MNEPSKKTVTPQEILDFLFKMVDEKVEITKGYRVISHRMETFINGVLAESTTHGCLNGFGLKTSVGCTFDIEITRSTEIAVAWAYFDHCVQYYEQMRKENETLGGGLEEYYRNRLEELKEWRDKHH